METGSQLGQSGTVRIPPWLWVFLGVLVVRLAPLTAFANSPFLIPDDGDMAFYHQWAMRALKGGLTDGQAFYGLPGYPFLLAVIYRLLGLNFLLVSLLQFVLDAVTGAIIFQLTHLALACRSDAPDTGRRARIRAALPYVAALGWTVFQPSQAFSLILMPTAWTLCFYWACVFLLARWHCMVTPARAVALGLATGVFSMVVATVLALVPLAGATALFSRMPWSRRVVVLPLMLAGVLAGTSPCWLYNRYVAGEPVFLSAHSGLNLYVGNNPLANGYPRLPPELGATQAGMLRDSILVAEKTVGRPLTHAEVSEFWADRARTWMKENRPAWAALSLRKFANFWNAFEYDDLSALTIFRENQILTPGTTFGLLALLGLPGLIWALWRGNSAARLAAAAVLAHMAVLLPVFITERYRLPAAPGLFVLAAFFAGGMADTVLRRQWLLLTAALALLVASGVFVFAPRDPALANHDLYNSGRAALAAGQLDLAENKLSRAAKLSPDNAEIQFSLGNLRLEQGDRYAAKMLYRRTLELNPQHDRAWNNLAVLALEENHLDLALNFISQAISLFPEDAKSYYIKAKILEKLGRPNEARAAATQALTINPDQPAFRELARSLGMPD